MRASFATILARLRSNRDAHVGTLSALVVFAVVGASAVAVDASSFFLQKRKLQSAVDVAAMAAVSNMPNAATSARSAMIANGISPVSLAVSPGAYNPDPTLPVASRFVGASAGNAASVAATIYAPMLLGRIFGVSASGSAPPGSVAISATGRAAALPTATFSLGSRLASLDPAIANATLSALLGGNAGLQLLDYQALASAKLNLGTLLQTVAAKVGSSSGTYADVLGTRVSLSTILSAAASSGIDSQSAAAINAVLAALPNGGGGTVALGNLVGLGSSSALPLSSALPVSVTLDAYDVLSQAVALASAGRTATVDLGAAAPGLADALLSVTVGPNGPATAIAPFGFTTTARTNQFRLTLTTKASFAGLGTVTLPIVLDLGNATATTSGPSCAAGAASLGLVVTPAAAVLAIGQPGTNPPSVGPAPVASILGIPVLASGSASAGSASSQETFDTADVAAGTVKTATASASAASLLASALANTKLTVGNTTIPLVTGNAILLALSSLAPPSATLLDKVARALGVGIGQADTWVTALKCGTPALVQ